MRLKIALALLTTLGIGAATRVATLPPFDPVADIGKSVVISPSGQTSWATPVGATGATNNLIALATSAGVTKDSGIPLANVVLVSRNVIAGTGLTGGGALTSDITLSQAVSNGTTNAPTGAVGELIKGELLWNSAGVSLVSGTAKTIVSITITPGDWQISWMCGTIGGSASATTVSSGTCGLSRSTNALPAAPNNPGSVPDTVFQTTATLTAGSATTTQPVSITTYPGVYQVLTSSSITFYLVENITFSVNTLFGYGSVQARRMR